MQRRELLRNAALASAIAAATAELTGANEAQAKSLTPYSTTARRNRALQLRTTAARNSNPNRFPVHPTNGEEEQFPGFIASYSKGLPHNDRGEVDPGAYQALLKALATGKPDDFEAIPLAGALKLTSPQSCLAFDLLGPDSHALIARPAPRIDSAEGAGDEVELYWMALCRDIHFSDWGSHPLTNAAAADLNRLSDFRGPRQGSAVTTSTLFRGDQLGANVGPYLSQFLWLDIPMGAVRVEQKMDTYVPGLDYITNPAEWLAIQRGASASAGSGVFEPRPVYIRNLRDLAQWVHVDALYQAYHQACLILLGLGCPLDSGIPVNRSQTQKGFVEWGGPHILTLVTEVATRALKATWHQKWAVHRRLRPEVFGQRIHMVRTGQASYPIHPQALNTAALDHVFSRYGNYLLPQAFPEGSPSHPSYTAGHATVAGACVTILKAFFDESFVIPNPVVPDAEGQTLIPYTGPALTVGGELDKVACNVGIGRNGAGVHYRSDHTESMLIGEAVAIAMLQEQKATYNQPATLSLTKFDGSRVSI